MAKNKKRRKYELPQAIEELVDRPNIRTLDDDEWETYEDYLREAVEAIKIPIDLTPRDILRINAEIDHVYSLARFDAAFIKQKLKRYEQRLSNAQKQAKMGFKNQRGLSAEDREALVVTYLETSKFKSDEDPLYVSVERWQERNIFMEAVLDNLKRKADKMLTGNGALKLDAQGRGDVGGD